MVQISCQKCLSHIHNIFLSFFFPLVPYIVQNNILIVQNIFFCWFGVFSPFPLLIFFFNWSNLITGRLLGACFSYSKCFTFDEMQWDMLCILKKRQNYGLRNSKLSTFPRFCSWFKMIEVKKDLSEFIFQNGKKENVF